VSGSIVILGELTTRPKLKQSSKRHEG
jgi:hypothetical protein